MSGPHQEFSTIDIGVGAGTFNGVGDCPTFDGVVTFPVAGNFISADTFPGGGAGALPCSEICWYIQINL